MGPEPWSLFSECWALSQLFHSPLSPASRSSLVPVRFLSRIICIPEVVDISPSHFFSICDSSSLAFHMLNSAYKLNKYRDNIQLWRTPFPVLNQSIFICLVLTVASWPAYRFCRRQVRWSGIPSSWRIFQFVVIHTIKGFSLVNEAEVDVFLELSCFFDDPTDVGYLISGSSAFAKTSLNIWKFMVHVLLKPGLENFVHYFTSNCAVVWTFFGIAFLWDWNENRPFPVMWPCWVFQIFWHIEYKTLTALSFRIWNSSAEIPSPQFLKIINSFR